jgi:hypothetical protein
VTQTFYCHATDVHSWAATHADVNERRKPEQLGAVLMEEGDFNT